MPTNPVIIQMLNGLNNFFLTSARSITSNNNNHKAREASPDLAHMSKQFEVFQKVQADQTKALKDAEAASKKRKLALMESIPTSKRAIKKQVAMAIPEYYELLYVLEQDTQFPFYQDSIIKRMKQRADLPLRVASLKRQLESLENDLAELKTVEISDGWAMDKVYKPMIFHYGKHYYREVPFVSSIDRSTTSTPPPKLRLQYDSGSPSSSSLSDSPRTPA